MPKLILVWLGLLLPCFVAIELTARHLTGYPLFPLLRLEEPSGDIHVAAKLYNRRRFTQSPPSVESASPIEYFESESPSPPYLFKPNGHYLIRKGQFVAARQGEDASFVTNQAGFLGEPISATKTADLFRIVCLGASTTQGTGDYREAYPYLMQQKLRQKFPDRRLEVINAGMEGQRLPDHLAVLENRILPLKPDLVVYFDHVNNVKYQEFFQWPEAKALPWGRRVLHSLYWRSAAFRLLANRFQIQHRLKLDLDLAAKGTLLDERDRGLRALVQLASSHGTPLIFLPYFLFAGSREFEATPEQVALILGKINGQMEAVARETKTGYCAGVASFPLQEKYFLFDGIHLNKDGQQILAGLVADCVGPYLTGGSASRQLSSGAP